MFKFLTRGRSAPPAVEPAPATALADHTPTKPAEDLAALVDLLEDDLRRAGARLRAAGSDIRSSAAANTELMQKVGQDSENLVEATGLARTDMGILTDRIEGMSASSTAIGGQASATSRLVVDAERAGGDATRSIDELKQAIGGIQEVVALITDIAGQTNLLALNATIEAARAGAAGRGFAVVASEVKALAVETQQATGEIGRRIALLRNTAEQSIGAVDRVIGIVNEIRPSAATVSASVDEQTSTISAIAHKAVEASAFAESVAGRAASISGATAEVVNRGAAIARQTDGFGATVDDMTRTLVTVLRQTHAGDRRRHDRWPIEIAGHFGGRRIAVTTIDLSLGGALVGAVDGLAPGERGQLSLEGLPPLTARIVATSRLGHHLAFESAAPEALQQRIVAIEAAYAEPIAIAVKGASLAAEALEAALARREISLHDLFDTDYQPIAGTDPQQYRNRALPVLERIMPPIQEPLLKAHERIVFAIAVDRNGFLPVHNTLYSQPQRPGDPVWNAANARNRRIFDDRTGLLAARNTRPFFVQSYLRDLGGGKTVVMREVDAPIRVAGRQWGGFRTAYRF